MAIQAYIDDSLTDNEVLVLAGYIAHFEEWEKFSIRWQELLDMSPRWLGFKMSDIASSKDELRWERAGWFYRPIEDHALAFVACAVEIGPLRQIVRELDLPTKMNNPYIFGLKAIVDATAQYQHELGIHEKVDFIFDDRGEEAMVREGFDYYKASLDENMQKLVGAKPRFESDLEFLPLQAADMLAWHVRKHWLTHRSITANYIELPWKKNRDMPGYKFNFDFDDLLRNLRRLRLKLIERGIMRSTTLKVTFTWNGKTF